MHPEQSSYDAKARPEVAAYVPPRVSSVLDVGCASGGFGGALRRARPGISRLVGVEPVESEAQAAETQGYDDVHVGFFPDALPPGTAPFDCVVLADVLEHMVDPWRALSDIKPFLSHDGVVVASIPSIQYLPVSLRAVAGRWTYTDEGTLDRTHLRFFTKSTMREMFEAAGFDILTLDGVNSFLAGDRYRFVRPLGRVLGNAQWLQFVVVARLSPTGKAVA